MTPTPPNPAAVLSAALDYLAAGLSVIPILADGTKAPALERGHPVLLRQRRATKAEAEGWWGGGRRGIGISAGPVSGNVECIDFDEPALILPWLDLVRPDVPRATD